MKSPITDKSNINLNSVNENKKLYDNSTLNIGINTINNDTKNISYTNANAGNDKNLSKENMKKLNLNANKSLQHYMLNWKDYLLSLFSRKIFVKKFEVYLMKKSLLIKKLGLETFVDYFNQIEKLKYLILNQNQLKDFNNITFIEEFD